MHSLARSFEYIPYMSIPILRDSLMLIYQQQKPSQSQARNPIALLLIPMHPCSWLPGLYPFSSTSSLSPTYCTLNDTDILQRASRSTDNRQPGCFPSK